MAECSNTIVHTCINNICPTVWLIHTYHPGNAHMEDASSVWYIYIATIFRPWKFRVKKTRHTTTIESLMARMRVVHILQLSPAGRQLGDLLLRRCSHPSSNSLRLRCIFIYIYYCWKWATDMSVATFTLTMTSSIYAPTENLDLVD